MSELHELLRANKVNESKKCIDEILLGKEKKLLKAGVKKEDIHLKEEDILNEISNSFVYNKDNALIQVPTVHPFDVGKSCNIVTFVKCCSTRTRIQRIVL